MFQKKLIDGLQHQVKLYMKESPELMEQYNILEDELDRRNDGYLEMINIFCEINRILNSDRNILSFDNNLFLEHIESHLIYENKKEKYLLIPVYSFIRPLISSQFLQNILLILEWFSTKIYLSLYATIKDSFSYTKLIVPNFNITSLQHYSNELSFFYLLMNSYGISLT